MPDTDAAAQWFAHCPEHGDCETTTCTCCGAVTHHPAGFATTTGHGLCSQCAWAHGGPPRPDCLADVEAEFHNAGGPG